jgi:hypothetical protein
MLCSTEVGTRATIWLFRKHIDHTSARDSIHNKLRKAALLKTRVIVKYSHVNNVICDRNAHASLVLAARGNSQFFLPQHVTL